MVVEGFVMTSDEYDRQHDSEVALNYRMFAEQREHIRRDFAGQYVGFALGRVIAADPDIDKVIAALNALEPQPISSCAFRAEEEPVFEVVDSISSEILDE